MFKVLKGYVRRHVENRNHPKRRTESASKKQRSSSYYCFYDRSFVPDYVRRMNRRFLNCRRSLISVQESCNQEKGTDDTFKTATYLRNPWIEAIGWSGTLAFGWAFSQNFHLYVRKRNLPDYSTFYQNDQTNLQKHLCPHHILKNILLSNVLAQPNDLVNVKSLLRSEKLSLKRNSLPVIGPKTADQALSEASDGVKKVHNETVGELENRLGLRCMSRQQYRKAVIHFAAGSALQNGSATFNLAQCYELGLGTQQSYIKAAKCYRVASDLGNASATYNLAVFYAHGYGGLKTDRNRALQLLENAVALGEPNAKKLLDRYVFNKPTERKQNCTKKTTEDRSHDHQDEIASVSSRFTALSLTFTHANSHKVLKNDVMRRTSTKSNSISTDDGLASEYESSSSSDITSSGGSESSGECIYQSKKKVARSDSNKLSINLKNDLSGVNELASKSESCFGFPRSSFLKIYPLSGASVADL